MVEPKKRKGRPPKTERDEWVWRMVYYYRFVKQESREHAIEMVSKKLDPKKDNTETVRRILRSIKGSRRLELNAEFAMVLSVVIDDPPMPTEAANRRRRRYENFESWEAGNKAAEERWQQAIKNQSERARLNALGELWLTQLLREGDVLDLTIRLD